MTPRQLMGGSQAAAGFLFLPVTVRFVDRLRLEEASGSSKKPHKTGTLWWLLPPPSLCFAPNRLFTLPYPALLFDIRKVHSTEFKENYQMGPLQCRPDIPQGQVSLSGYQS